MQTTQEEPKLGDWKYTIYAPGSHTHYIFTDSPDYLTGARSAMEHKELGTQTKMALRPLDLNLVHNQGKSHTWSTVVQYIQLEHYGS